MTIKELIRMMMKDQSIGIVELSKKIGITKATMWNRLDPQKSNNMSLDTLKSILDWLGYEIVIRSKDKTTEYVYGTDIAAPKTAYDFDCQFKELAERRENGTISDDDYKNKVRFLSDEYEKAIRPKYD